MEHSQKIWSMKRIQNEGAPPSGEVLIFGELAEGKWFEDDVTPREFYEDLQALGDVGEITVRINSYGGDVSAGSAIYSLLKQHKAHVTVRVEGFALSAASVVAMAGDTVIMPRNTMMMIHNPWTYTEGNSGHLRKVADTLDKIRDAMVAAYTAKTGMEAERIVEMLDAETWMTADEAAALGFADETEEALEAVACAGLERHISSFRNAPRGLLEKIEREAKQMETREKRDPVEEPAAQASAIDTDAIFAAGKAAGIEEERARQKALDELTVPGMEDVVARAKYETGDTPEAVAVALIKAQKAAGAAALALRKQDAAESGAAEVAASYGADGVGAPAYADASKELNSAIKAKRGIK